MKAILLILFGVILGVLAAYFFLPTVMEPASVNKSETDLETYTLDVFRFAIEQQVDKKLGKPEAGYVPDLYLKVFPGMAPTDFANVPTVGGRYEINDGLIIFVENEDEITTVTSNAIGRKGVEVLLKNISTRTKVDLKSNGTLTDIMRSITRE